MPFIKDKRGDVTNMDNYRGIAISSVTSKQLETVLLRRLKTLCGLLINNLVLRAVTDVLIVLLC